MSQLPTTPGSIILEDKPKLFPEDMSRYMGSVWHLQDDGMWLRLTDDGKRGARTWPDRLDQPVTVLYEAPADPKPYEELRRATEDLQTAELRLRGRQQEVDSMRRTVERLREACEATL